MQRSQDPCAHNFQAPEHNEPILALDLDLDLCHSSLSQPRQNNNLRLKLNLPVWALVTHEQPNIIK